MRNSISHQLDVSKRLRNWREPSSEWFTITQPRFSPLNYSTWRIPTNKLSITSKNFKRVTVRHIKSSSSNRTKTAWGSFSYHISTEGLFEKSFACDRELK